jgi:DNA-binding transcriptional LysR family regulator
MDRLVAMQTFVRVVEAGGFSAVARERNTTQSAVSKQVAALEAHLGAKLLIRTTRSLALTDDGERYFEEARRLVDEVAEAEGLLRHGQQQLKGWLRVAASVGFGLRVLLPHVNRFLAAHPDLKIDFKLNDNTIDLVEHGIDVAIRIGVLSDSSLVARRVGSSHAVVVASRNYIGGLPAGLAPPLTPDDLLRHPCVVYTELRTRNVWNFTGVDGSLVNVPVGGPLQTNNSEVVRAAVLSGMGIAAPPTWMFKDELASGEVQILLRDWRISSLPIHLLFAPHRQRAAKVRAFSEHMALALAG